jgi:hypothetical protein
MVIYYIGHVYLGPYVYSSCLNFPGPMFIPCPTSIPEARVHANFTSIRGKKADQTEYSIHCVLKELICRYPKVANRGALYGAAVLIVHSFQSV